MAKQWHLCNSDSHRITVHFCHLRIFACPLSCCYPSLPKETSPIPCVCPTWLWVCCDWSLLLCLASFEIRLLLYVVIAHSLSLLGNVLLYLNLSVLLLLSIWVVTNLGLIVVLLLICVHIVDETPVFHCFRVSTALAYVFHCHFLEYKMHTTKWGLSFGKLVF